MDPAWRVKQRPQGARSTLNPYFLLQMGGACVQAPPARTSAGTNASPDGSSSRGGWQKDLARAEPLKVMNQSPNLGLHLKSVPVLLFTSCFGGLCRLLLAALFHAQGGDRNCLRKKEMEKKIHRYKRLEMLLGPELGFQDWHHPNEHHSDTGRSTVSPSTSGSLEGPQQGEKQEEKEDG